MSSFIAEHFIEILFGLISAGLLAFCKHIYSQMNAYRKLAENEKKENLEKTINEHLEPIKQELHDLRSYVLVLEDKEEQRMNLILTSYKFRLVQLCEVYLRKGFLTYGEYEQLNEFYKVYNGLGGNGQGKEYYEKTIKLPIQQ